MSPENNVFAMLDAIGRNRKDEAFRLLHNLLDSGTPVYNLLRLITGQLELILSVKEMKDEGKDAGPYAEDVGSPSVQGKKGVGGDRLYSMEDLRKALSAAMRWTRTSRPD